MEEKEISEFLTINKKFLWKYVQFLRCIYIFYNRCKRIIWNIFRPNIPKNIHLITSSWEEEKEEKSRQIIKRNTPNPLWFIKPGLTMLEMSRSSSKWGSQVLNCTPEVAKYSATILALARLCPALDFGHFAGRELSANSAISSRKLFLPLLAPVEPNSTQVETMSSPLTFPRTTALNWYYIPVSSFAGNRFNRFKSSSL